MGFALAGRDEYILSFTNLPAGRQAQSPTVVRHFRDDSSKQKATNMTAGQL